MRELWDDEQLLDALKASLRARQSVPPEFVQAGRNAYAWHHIDAELAQLTYDSAGDRGAVASMRSESASLRALTFTSAHLTIELEIAADCVHGQVIPTQPGAVQIQAPAQPIDHKRSGPEYP